MRARACPIVPALVLLAASGALTAPASAAWPHDPYNGNVAVCTASGDQQLPQSLADGAGGVFVVWIDHRGPKPAIYAQRVSAAGVPEWAADGIPVCTASGDQLDPAFDRDGAGGFIVAWRDYRSLLNLVNFVVVTRPGFDPRKIWQVLPEDMTLTNHRPPRKRATPAWSMPEHTPHFRRRGMAVPAIP